MPTTRLAPSPTGALHLGNARTFLLNWLLARKHGWKIILRIEDLDRPRNKSGTDQEMMEDLRWLGIDWDEGPIYQTSRTAIYETVINSLVASGKAYACICTRKDVETAASAPHIEDRSPVYPGTCRGRFTSSAQATLQTSRPATVRFKVDSEAVSFDDCFAGHYECNAARELGDFVIAKADGTAAYQLAVVVDDAEMEVTDVVRGDDLLDSTPRQILIYRALGLQKKIPRHYHVPLMLGPDGRRLAKRQDAIRLSLFRKRGLPASRMLSLLARWCGITIEAGGIGAANLIDSFDLQRVPREPIVCSAEDLARLWE